MVQSVFAFCFPPHREGDRWVDSLVSLFSDMWKRWEEEDQVLWLLLHPDRSLQVWPGALSWWDYISLSRETLLNQSHSIWIYDFESAADGSSLCRWSQHCGWAFPLWDGEWHTAIWYRWVFLMESSQKHISLTFNNCTIHSSINSKQFILYSPQV